MDPGVFCQMDTSGHFHSNRHLKVHRGEMSKKTRPPPEYQTTIRGLAWRWVSTVHEWLLSFIPLRILLQNSSLSLSCIYRTLYLIPNSISKWHFSWAPAEKPYASFFPVFFSRLVWTLGLYTASDGIFTFWQDYASCLDPLHKNYTYSFKQLYSSFAAWYQMVYGLVTVFTLFTRVNGCSVFNYKAGSIYCISVFMIINKTSKISSRCLCLRRSESLLLLLLLYSFEVVCVSPPEWYSPSNSR